VFGTTKSIASAIPLRSRPKDSGMSLELYALGARCEYVCIMCKVDHAFLAWSGDGPTTRCPPLKLAGSCTCDQAPPRAPACRAPGSIGGVFGLSPFRQGSLLLVPRRAARSTLDDLAFACTRPTHSCMHMAGRESDASKCVCVAESIGHYIATAAVHHASHRATGSSQP
jgi:hypothetical protein